jgi:hypothetical protein
MRGVFENWGVASLHQLGVFLSWAIECERAIITKNIAI